MIYFMPNWRQKDLHLEREKIMSVMQSFVKEKQECRLILLHYFPFLRYKLQEYDNLTKHYWNVYDVAQNINVKSGRPIEVSDLDLPENVEKVDCSQGLTLTVNGESEGYISFNQYGCLDRVIFTENTQFRIDHYDDRGFVSSKEYFTNNGIAVKRLYFNEKGKHTLSEYFGDTPRVVVEKDGNDCFKHKKYQHMDDLLNDIVHEYALQFDEEDHLIAPLDIEQYRSIKIMHQKIQLWLVVSEEEKLEKIPPKILTYLFSITKGFVTATIFKKKELQEIIKRYQKNQENKVHMIPIYATQLALGSSNTSDQLLVYFRFKHLDKKNSKLHKHLVNELLENSTYNLILEVADTQTKEQLLQRQKHQVDNYYEIDSDSTDYKKVAHYINMRKETSLLGIDARTISNIKNIPQCQAIVDVLNVHSRIEIQINPTVEIIQQGLHQARIFIDLSNEPDLKIQSLAVSTGIPLIVRKQSSYIADEKNGKIVARHSEMISALNYFLKNTGYWNKSLVENIEIIEKNSDDQLVAKWMRLFNQ